MAAEVEYDIESSRQGRTRVRACRTEPIPRGHLGYSVELDGFMWTFVLSQATIGIGTIRGFSRLRRHVHVASTFRAGGDERV